MFKLKQERLEVLVRPPLLSTTQCSEDPT